MHAGLVLDPLGDPVSVPEQARAAEAAGRFTSASGSAASTRRTSPPAESMCAGGVPRPTSRWRFCAARER
ncbi:MAG: hypothetical protein ACLQDY_17065 [Streptosporangiaceae bacterium]